MVVLMVFSFFFLMYFWFLFFLLNFYFYSLKYFFVVFSYSNGFLFDFMSVLMVVLTLLVFFSSFFSGSFDYFKGNNWLKFLVLMVFFFCFLTVLFLLSNYLIFYMLFEFVVMPIFIFIIGWGYSTGRLQSSLYMFLYTFFFSLPLLVMLMFFGFSGLFFNYNFFNGSMKSFEGYLWVFVYMVFLVKLPVFFLHLWLPKAHVDAPLLGSMVLAGVLLKLGGYGVYKSLIYFFFYSYKLLVWVAVFSFFGGIMMGVLCLRQVDLKNLIAYSSVVHMGPVLGSLFLLSFSSLLGGFWMMFSHGLCSSCLFFLLNMMYLNSNSRSFLLNRGGFWVCSVVSFVWFIMAILNMGFPPSFNFFSELFIIVGVFSFSKFLPFFLFFILMLSGFYNIILFSSCSFGSSKNFLFHFFFSVKDFLSVFISMFPLVFFIFFGGFCFCQFYFC